MVVAMTTRSGAGRQAATPEKKVKEPPGRTCPARCLASSSGPITLASNARRTASSARPDTGPLAGIAAVETRWSNAPARAARAAMDSSSARSTRWMPAAGVARVAAVASSFAVEGPASRDLGAGRGGGLREVPADVRARADDDDPPSVEAVPWGGAERAHGACPSALRLSVPAGPAGPVRPVVTTLPRAVPCVQGIVLMAAIA
ncbi:hypothetical protein GCM10020254_10340 [Streptomyces goshikiensis]